ncbi:MAG TPA: LpqB family beta-propeller domain-containing protein [Acidimicrobiales bacterium]|nr:LpqB family beta-propeller domain-containing protein [Acidimicrobiales bacterium]
MTSITRVIPSMARPPSRALLVVGVALALASATSPIAHANGRSDSPPEVVPRLAFVDGSVLRVVDADGRGERMLDVSGSAAAPVVWDGLLDPSWSPDGTRIAYGRAMGATWIAGPSELRIANADASRRETVLRLAGGVIHDVRLSPDGSRLAFVLFTPNPAEIVTWGLAGNRWDVYVLDVDGSGLRPVAPLHASEAHTLDWSPDGSKLAFVSDAGGITGVYTVAADEPALPVRVSPLDVAARDPRWSPDGKSIAFTGRDLLPITELLDHSRLWIARADGTNARPLPARTWGRPAWSPDGRWLAYLCVDDPCGINVIRTDGSTGRTLTTRPAFSLAWSRHGQIAFVAGDREASFCCPRTLRVMEGDGTDEREVTRATSVGLGIAWSE